jgi:peptidoglycan/LPS O-acetylase OafA/YrhL
MSTASARNPGIDLLRGLSIVLVLLNHIGLRIRLTQGVLAGFLPRQFLNDLTFKGSEAVFIFFVIMKPKPIAAAQTAVSKA